jgi:uncharacterized protein YndB with AHSA1/START domain
VQCCGNGGWERLITIAMSKVIRSPRARVWRALVSPDELIRWDERRISLEAPIPDYPKPGRSARWRCQLGSLTVVHHEDPLEVIPAERLRSAVRLASFEFEETYTLADQAPSATRLSLRVIARNTLPVFGGELDRFDVRRLSAERVDQTLAQLQRWCEAPAHEPARCEAPRSPSAPESRTASGRAG